MTLLIISMIRDAWGGSEELWYEMAKEAIKQGHRVIHMAYEHPAEHPKMRELRSLGMISLRRPGYIAPEKQGWERYGTLIINRIRKEMAKVMDKAFAMKPDIVLYNGTCYSIAREKELLHQLAKSSAAFFLLGHYNNEHLREINDAQAEQIRSAYIRARKVFFTSHRSIAAAERQLGTSIRQAEVVRNPVNLADHQLLPYPSLDGEIHLACVANLVTVHKGQDILLDSLRTMNTTNWHLHLYGKGSDEKYLKHLVEHWQLGDRVHFHGQVQDIRAVWKQSHVLVMCSHMEGMPLAVVEAMLCGRVCIVTDVGGNAEWIRQGKEGFLAPAASTEAFAQTLQESFNHLSRWPAIGEAAHNRAMELYDAHAGASLLRRIIAP